MMKLPTVSICNTRGLLSLVFVILAGTALAVSDSDVEASLDNLDRVLSQRANYIKARQSRIDSLNMERLKYGDTPRLMNEIAEAYTSFNNDSAIAFLRRGAEMSDGITAMQYRWKIASLLPLGGFFEMAHNTYDSINPDSIPRELLPSYYDAGRQMHSYISAFFKLYPEISKPHTEASLALQQKLLEALPSESPEYKFNLGEYYFLTDRRQMARVLLEEVVDREPAGSNLRARAAHHLSTIALDEGNTNAYKYYLALSAIADVVSATREVLSLQELGTAVYADNQVTRAHKYLSTAMENAVECGAPLRMVDTSKSLPIIERAHSGHISTWRRTIYWIIGAMGLLMLGLIASMLVLRHEMHRMTVLQANLRAANTAKEVYISQFLQLCSIYMDKLNSFCKIAARKLAAGQSDELYRMTKSGKFVEEQSREFYEVFDNAFLHIYPDFVSKVNALLRPEEQILLRPGELLNTDLRILAFMRLGIEESARIAQVLNYSLNTIYTYRNRLKARALNRDTFETDILKITSEN